MAEQRIGYFLYNTFLALAALILWPLIVFRILTKFPTGWTVLKEKTGVITKPVIWIHAATEGQIATLANIYQELTRVFTRYQLVVTCTGNKAATFGRSLAPELMLIVFPYSVEYCSKKIISYLKPQLLLLIDDCFYPNLLRHCKTAGSKSALIGGRVNKRLSFTFRLAPNFLKSILKRIDLLMMTSVTEANQVGKLGAALSTIVVSNAVGEQEDRWKGGAELNDNDSLKKAVGAIGTLLGGTFET